jgi:uncharacterized protein (TIGR02757 family)
MGYTEVMPLRRHKRMLEDLYQRFTTRERAARDPVKFLYRYDDSADREVAAVVAASLAYGRVEQIIKSVDEALGRLGNSPATTLRHMTHRELFERFADFRHRVTGGVKFAAMLEGLCGVLAEHGSLAACFEAGRQPEDESLLDPLTRFVYAIDPHRRCGHLLADPAGPSACKRLHLMLRWLVRQDAVDPGGWRCIQPGELLMPVDTHVLQWSRRLGLTRRKQPSRAAVLDITAAFRRIAPEDPLRYDFAIAHAGMAELRNA